MISKSKVRQSALAAIYAVMENGGDSGKMDWDLFWSIAEEKESEQITLATARAIEHQCRPNADMVRLLEERAGAVTLEMEGDLTTAPLREKLERYMRNSTQFNAALGTLHYSLKNRNRLTPEQIERENAEVLRLAPILTAMGDDLLPCFDDFPAYRKVLAPLAATARRRAKMLQSCAILAKPAELINDTEFRGLARQAQDLQELRPAAQELAQAVLAQREVLDARIEPLLQNYSAERLDTVDKCILYLALYELDTHKLDVPIVVSEAVALANTYSGGKSAPFIHGIIAAAAKA